MWLFYCFNFKRNYGVLKAKSPYILLNKNKNFHKNETELKIKNSVKWRTLCSYKNCKLKVKLWWVGIRDGKRRALFVPFILYEGNLFNNCALSQCIVYWIHFHYILLFRMYSLHSLQSRTKTFETFQDFNVLWFTTSKVMNEI